MSKTKIVYQLTQSEYNILTANLNKIHEILSHAQIIESKVKQPVENDSVGTERVTDGKVRG